MLAHTCILGVVLNRVARASADRHASYALERRSPPVTIAPALWSALPAPGGNARGGIRQTDAVDDRLIERERHR
jgi:hypothetical protein